MPNEMENFEPISGPVTVQATKEEWETSGSKFVSKAGEYESEMGMPGWKEKGRTMAFPITITQEGPEKGKTGYMYVGLGSAASWKLKEVLGAVGVAVKFNKTGAPQFNPAECAGKACLSIWVAEVDNKREGATGKTFIKLQGLAALGSEAEQV
jgi:hypothetical protein